MRLSNSRPSETRSQDRLADRLLVVGVLVATGAVFLVTSITLGRKSLWLDEAESVWLACLPVGALVNEVIQRHADQAAFFMLLHFWIPLGSSEAIVRLPSLLASVLALVLTFIVGRRLLGLRAALLGTGLLGTSAFFVQEAQETRSYALLLATILLATYLLLRVVERPTVRNAALFAASSLLSVYLHPFALFVCLSQAVSVVFVRERAVRQRLLTALLVVTVFSVPLLLVVNGQHVRGSIWNPPRPTSIRVLMVPLINLAGGSWQSLLFLIAFSVFGAVQPLWSHLPGRPPRWNVFLLSAWFALPLTLMLASSLTVQSVWIDRYLFICLPPLVLLAASGILTLRPRLLLAPAIVLALGLAVINLTVWFGGSSKEDWREAVRYVRAHQSPEDPILILPENLTIPFGYYDADGIVFTRSVHPDKVPNPGLAGTLAQHARLWLVDDDCRQSERGKDAVAALKQDYTVASTRTFDGLYCTIRVSEEVRR